MNLLGSHDMPRFLTLARGDQSALRLATLFQMTYPGAPSVYYGDEIGMSRRPRSAQPPRLPLAPARRPGTPRLLHEFQRLIALRKPRPALRRGTFRSCYAEGDVFAYARALGDETVIDRHERRDGDRGGSTSRSRRIWPTGLGWTRSGRTRSVRVEAGMIRGLELAPRSGRVFATPAADAMSLETHPPAWRLPEGVNASLWQYTHTPRLAEDEDEYFRGHPCSRPMPGALDARFIEPGPLVDLGCGTGRHALRFARRGFPVVAVELSQRDARPGRRPRPGGGRSAHPRRPGEPLPARVPARRRPSPTPSRCSAPWG